MEALESLTALWLLRKIMSDRLPREQHRRPVPAGDLAAGLTLRRRGTKQGHGQERDNQGASHEGSPNHDKESKDDAGGPARRSW